MGIASMHSEVACIVGGVCTPRAFKSVVVDVDTLDVAIEIDFRACIVTLFVGTNKYDRVLYRSR